MYNLQLFQPGDWQRRWDSTAYHLTCASPSSPFISPGARVKGEAGLYPHDSWMVMKGSSSSIFLSVRLSLARDWGSKGRGLELTFLPQDNKEDKAKTQGRAQNKKTSKRLALSQTLNSLVEKCQRPSRRGLGTGKCNEWIASQHR